MSLIDHKLHNLDRVQPERHRNGSLAIHPYFGKVDPALARTLIQDFSQPGDVVLDPFCGSGTVLHEALLLKRSVAGWDSSPLAQMLATAKLLGIDDAERRQIENCIKELGQYGKRYALFRQPVPTQGNVPPMPRVQDISSWFEVNALAELAFLKFYLTNKYPNMLPGAAFLAQTAFSRIIVAASNQQSESSYRRVRKLDHQGRVIDLFIDALKSVSEAAGKFCDLMHILDLGERRSQLQLSEFANRISWKHVHADIFIHDTRSTSLPNLLGDLQADLVVTSPPYLMSWDYGLYHKFRFYWLGFDLDAYEETEIGRHLRRKQDDIEHYREDMLGAFLSISQSMKLGAYIIMINAPSVVHGIEVDTNAILTDCAKAVGWHLVECVPTIGIPGPHHGMYESLDTRGTSLPGERGKKEHVLIFKQHHQA